MIDTQERVRRWPFALLLVLIGVGACFAWASWPRLIHEPRPGNHMAAHGALKTIHAAQSLFRESDKDGDRRLDYAKDLRELEDARLIDNVLATGTKMGYLITVQRPANDASLVWMATACPGPSLEPGWPSYVINQDGAIFYTSSPIPMNDTCTIPACVVPLGK